MDRSPTHGRFVASGTVHMGPRSGTPASNRDPHCAREGFEQETCMPYRRCVAYRELLMLTSSRTSIERLKSFVAGCAAHFTCSSAAVLFVVRRSQL